MGVAAAAQELRCESLGAAAAPILPCTALFPKVVPEDYSGK